jgi:hypothetical protein
MKIAAFSSPPDRLWVDKFGWLVAGLKSLDHDVLRFDHFSELPGADAWADLVLFDQYAAGLPPRNIRDIGESKTAVWIQCWRDLFCQDPRKPAGKQEGFQLYGQVMKAMDIVFVKERSRIEEYQSAGVNAVYLDCQGCPEQMESCHYVDKPEFDVLVLGNAERSYVDRRADAAALVQAGYRVLWAGRSNYPAPHGVIGHRWVHPLKELPALSSRCACALSVDLRYEPGYTSDRTWLLAGCGIPVIARVPEIATEESFADPSQDAWSWCYMDRELLVGFCVSQAVADFEERRHRGRLARQRVMERHTYQHRAESILAHVESLQAVDAK